MSLQQTCVEGVWMWSEWQPDRSMNFNSFFIAGAENILVDPLPCDDATIALLQSLGGVAWIVLTNRDHERASRVLATTFGAKIAAPTLDAPQLSAPVDRTLDHGDTIASLRVVAFAGMKSPGECALYSKERSVAIVGDALLGDPVGSLRMLPVEKLGDAKQAVLSLRALRMLQPKHLLTGDGSPIFHEASAAIDRYLRSRTDVLAARVNLDELSWSTFESDPAPYNRGAAAEVGYVIGAGKLGYRVARIQQGGAFCPLHWHAAEEELFYVIEGNPIVRTPGGEYQCRAGDFIAFPTDPDAAHRIRNEQKEDALVLMLSNVDERDVCSYPDSDKILFEREGLIVRRAPALDYFDGEVG